MPTVAGLGLTFNLPNYTGEVLAVTPSETPFLTAIGGLNEQGEILMSTEAEGETQDLGTPSQPAHLEGADAPALSNRSRGKWDNVVQIFQYAYGVSYTRQAASQLLAGLANGRTNPVTDEMANQDELALKTAARDINWSFINGVYQKPVDNTTARRTRGLLACISTNANSGLGAPAAVTGTASNDTVTWAGHGLSAGDVVVFSALTGGAGLAINTPYYVKSVVDANTITLAASLGGALIDITSNMTAGTAAAAARLSKVGVLDMVQGVWGSFGFDQGAEPTLLCNATLKRGLTKLFITDANYREETRNVGGVSVTRIETDFGAMNILLERAMPAHTLGFAHLALCKPAYLMIPDKGFLFAEELAKTGAQIKKQLYGEVGLWHGPEQAHAKITYVSPVQGA
jgi:hypothetical protein